MALPTTRARKAGDAFEVESKMGRRYDAEEKLGTPSRVIDWINRVLAGDVQPCAGTSCEQIQNHLRNGVVLCKLINKLLAADGKPPLGFRAKANIAFVAMSNIECFNQGAKEYGVKETAIFQTTDLYEGRKAQMLNVINCINGLGFKANAKGFNIMYEAVEAPKMDADAY